MLSARQNLCLGQQCQGTPCSNRSWDGLEKRAVMVRLPAEARDFCLLPCVHTGSGAHPGSYLENTGGCSLFSVVTQHRLMVTCRLLTVTHAFQAVQKEFYLNVKKPGRKADHYFPSNVEIKNAYDTHAPSCRAQGQLLFISCFKIQHSTFLKTWHFCGCRMIFGINQSFGCIRRWPVGPFGGDAGCLLCDTDNLFPIIL